MFLSILQKEHLDLTSSIGRPRLYGTTSMQVISKQWPYVIIILCHNSKANLLLFYCHYEDVEFGRLQARDMLQHLWTGPISNAAVDVVQGSRSVEVRSVGVTKVCECRFAGHLKTYLCIFTCLLELQCFIKPVELEMLCGFP